ncbi:dTMP kinase [Sandarakinorhabdus sp.]|uniref:dTMP kinase n=1 Tax=Sandarakinorhabdus sp. TaxID=1916663 RepID=UPI00286E0BE2|nr:dTMP kinase [Sandarakinorhabdus sp.]
MPGRFITLEGGEGSGKSTQARRLASHFVALGHEVVLTREPGGTAGGEAVRDLLVNGAPDRWTPWAEACLMNASRAEHVALVIRPALAAGATVICDRFVDSTRAYQGAGKGLADDDLKALHAMACGGLWPDITLVFHIDPGVGLARTQTRAGGEGRFEAHDSAFHARIAAFFDALSVMEPARCHQIDASADVDNVFRAVLALMP